MIEDKDASGTELNPSAAAACLVAILERRGALFTLRDDGTFLCDLDSCADVTTHDEAQELSTVILGMRDEIRTVLLSRRAIH